MPDIDDLYVARFREKAGWAGALRDIRLGSCQDRLRICDFYGVQGIELSDQALRLMKLRIGDQNEVVQV